MRNRAPRLAAAIAVVLALSGCQTVDEVKKVIDPPPAPEVGTCHRLDFVDIYGDSTFFDSSESVDCGKSHTSITFRTGDLPFLLQLSDFDYNADVAKEAMTYAVENCHKWGPKAAGLTEAQLASSYIGFTAFLPTLAEVDKGASWFRCDIVATYDDKALELPKTSTLPLFGDGVVPDALAICTDKDFNYTLCTQRHFYFFDRAFEIQGNTLPKRTAIEKFGDRVCRGDSYMWPGRKQFQDGDHWLLCGSDDKRKADPI